MFTTLVTVLFCLLAIAFFLRLFGAIGVFAFIAGSMVIVMLAIGLMGPRTRDLSLEEISH